MIVTVLNALYIIHFSQQRFEDIIITPSYKNAEIKLPSLDYGQTLVLTIK